MSTSPFFLPNSPLPFPVLAPPNPHFPPFGPTQTRYPFPRAPGVRHCRGLGGVAVMFSDADRWWRVPPVGTRGRAPGGLKGADLLQSTAYRRGNSGLHPRFGDV